MDLSIPVDGIHTAEAGFNSAAASLTSAFQGNTAVGGNGATSGDTADLSTAVVGLLSSKLDFLANTKVAQVEDNLTKSSFSLLA